MELENAEHEIDWLPLRKHLETRVSRDDPRYARRVADICTFAYFPENLRHTLIEKVKFESVDDYPPYLKYSVPQNIQFINAEPIWCQLEMISMKVMIENLINTDPEHFLCLHPERFDNVKRALSAGKIHMPRVILDSDGMAHIEDGRHRIIALRIFQMKEIEVSIPKTEATLILEQLKARL